jgi:alcohol dehydrogenase class IV
MENFRTLSFAQEVIFRPNALASLGESIDRFGWKRLMLLSGKALVASGHVKQVQEATGKRLVAVYNQVLPHVQDVQLDEVLALALETQVEAIIGLGGGSPIGMAKAVAFGMEQKLTEGQDLPHPPTGQPVIPVVAIPTTYAGSEMTAGFGITHSRRQPPVKITVSDPRIAPKLVLYDPLLTLDLPPELTASTGMNALAHCIEALYSVTRNPLSTAAAASAANYISHSLLSCYLDGRDLQARTEMLAGAHLAGLALAGVTMGLHHGLCHVLGGSANVPHGIANAIILPHAMRFNAGFTARELQPAAEALGIQADGHNPAAVVESAAEAVFKLTGQMALPQHLRQVGVKESDLPRLAELAFQNKTVRNNPRPITDISQLEGILKEAW